MKRKVITIRILHYNKFEYLKYPTQKYTGDIINDINKAEIYESAFEKALI